MLAAESLYIASRVHILGERERSVTRSSLFGLLDRIDQAFGQSLQVLGLVLEHLLALSIPRRALVRL